MSPRSAGPTELKEAFSRYVSALKRYEWVRANKGFPAPDESTPEQVREWRKQTGEDLAPLEGAVLQTMSAVLAAYARPENHPSSQFGAPIPREPLPAEIAYRAGIMLGRVAVGVIPPRWKELEKRRGRRAVDPVEAQDQRTAATYVLMAQRGIVRDRAPHQTVAKSFGITARASMKWVAHHRQYIRINHVFPDSPRESREGRARIALKRAGERYRLAGRGAEKAESSRA